MNEVVYLMIETQSSSEGPGAAEFVNTAVNLAKNGRRVSLWLLQNGVLNLLDDRFVIEAASFEKLEIKLYVDEFSMRQRSIEDEYIASADAHVSGMAELAAQLMRPQCKVIWH